MVPLLVSIAALLMVGAHHISQEATPKGKIILDTDIGGDVDDAYALALLVSQSNVDILGVTTAFGPTKERAQIAAKILSVMDRKQVPVFAGRSEDAPISDQYLWAKGFANPQMKSEGAASFIHEQVAKFPNQVTIIGIGPLTNLGDLLTQHPEDAAKIKQVVLMAGSVYVGYNNQPPPVVEYNLRCDPHAAQILFKSGVPIVMAGLEVTCMMKLDEARRKHLWGAGKPVSDALAALTLLWGHGEPTLYDPFAVAYATGHVFCEAEVDHIDVNDEGMTVLGSGPPNVTVLVKPKPHEFLDWYVAQIVGPG